MTTLVKVLLTFIVIFVSGGIVAIIKETGGMGWPVSMIALAIVFGIWKYKGNKG